jgi:transcriptional activator for dhaKLM operon
MRQMLRQATIAARGRAPVLLRGEGGVGKNSIARAIHNAGDRADKPFIAINCRAVPHELMISEFLGYDPSDNDKGRPSKFELAHGGTLLLDQIESLSLEMQSALLHMIETGHVMRLHSTRLIPIEVRLIAATTANLEALVAEQSFIRQLYYAFGVFNFYIPPLRERVEDIPFLAERFLSRMNKDQPAGLKIDEEALAVLCRYPWPGNVRELEHALERAINHSLDGMIRIIDLPEIVRSGRIIQSTWPTPQPIVTTIEAEREAIIRAGWACQGRVTEMAQQLGIGRTTLWRKLRHLNLTPNHFKR